MSDSPRAVPAAEQEDALTSRDKAVLEQLGEMAEEAEDEEEKDAVVEECLGEVRRCMAELRRFEHQTENRLDAIEKKLEDNPEPQKDYSEMTDLEMIESVPEEAWEDQFSTSKVIALTIHNYWDDIAWKMGDSNNRRIGVDTKTKTSTKYNPSKLKHHLKTELGWDPEWMQVYRGLEKLAKLSGGEELVDAGSGRVQIAGGDYEYREMATADNKDKKRVLWRSTE